MYFSMYYLQLMAHGDSGLIGNLAMCHVEGDLRSE